MTPHSYLTSILAGQRLDPPAVRELQHLREEIEGVLRVAYGSEPRCYYAGSFGKDTMIREAYDLDVVLSFPPTERAALRDIFRSVHGTLQSAGYVVRPRIVALRLPHEGGFHIDVVPGRAQDESFRYATLYRNGEDTTMQTSIKAHIETIRDSGCREVIKLMKLWRLRHGLDWETFALEQTVIRALHGRHKDDLSRCLWTVLEFLRDDIATVRLLDPANSNNVIEIPPPTRSALRLAADRCLDARTWEEIIW
jgi:hypothetical protein